MLNDSQIPVKKNLLYEFMTSDDYEDVEQRDMVCNHLIKTACPFLRVIALNSFRKIYKYYQRCVLYVTNICVDLFETCINRGVADR